MKKQAVISLLLSFVFLFSFINVHAEIVTYPLGDVNGDNEISVSDYVLVKRACLNTYELNFAQEDCADVDRNDTVNVSDYVLIKRHCLKNFVIQGTVDVDRIPNGAIVVNLVADNDTESVMKANTAELQKRMDEAHANGGGTLYIPAGTFYFASQKANKRGNEEYVCMPKDNVTVVGAGRNTVLMPVGVTEGGLDMFYFNEYADSTFTNPVYLVNSDFRDLVIDGARSNAKRYTSAGKGFMINLFKDCDYDNVVVRNTDGTGFGMDCPINCTITNCEAYNNGKLGSLTSLGASGFGIGTGYVDGESILIENCYAEGNKKFGVFFEHQARFQAPTYPDRYPAETAESFLVRNCTAKNNQFDFGGELAYDVVYRNCRVLPGSTSTNPVIFRNHSVRCFAYDMDVEITFEDVPTTSEYYDAIDWAVSAGITTGTSKTKFNPTGTCTLAEAITFLHRFQGFPGEMVANNKAENPYYEYALIWAKNIGLVNNNTHIDTLCTFNDILMYMWICEGKPSVYGEYSAHLNWAIKEGIVDSYSTNDVTRAEVAQIFYNYANR